MKLIALVATLAALTLPAFAAVPVVGAPYQAGGTGGGLSLDGAVVIINGVQKTLAPGEQPQLKLGDKVSVVSGNVTFIAPGGDKINANGAGAAFSVVPFAGDNALVNVNYTGGNVSVTDSKGNIDNLSAAHNTAWVAAGVSGVDSSGNLAILRYVPIGVPNVEQQKCLSGSTPGATGC